MDKSINEVFEAQKKYFSTGITKREDYRIASLKRLKKSIESNIDAVSEALKKDLGKNETEGYMMETGFVLSSINQTIKSLHKWAKDENVTRTITNPLSKPVIKSGPYGNVLIISPFNYPFQLAIEPMVAAVSAGNTVIIKASSLTPNTNKVISMVIRESFRPEHVYFVSNRPGLNEEVLKPRYDFIFFTGGTETAKKIMMRAAEDLIPVVLELGGRNPAIVMKDANIEIAARKILWGKFSNAGQTCIAPNHVLVHDSIYEKFIDALKTGIIGFYGTDPEKSSSFGRIISDEAFDRLAQCLNQTRGTVVFGGNTDKEKRYIEPTILRDVDWEDEILKKEIFGPILPIIRYKNINDEIEWQKSMEKPLATYVFSENIKNAEKVMNRLSFGGGCINDTLLHVSNPDLPFGGVGNSGMGRYHGKTGFDTFSNKKSIMITNPGIEMSFIYPPYTNTKKILVRQLLK